MFAPTSYISRTIAHSGASSLAPCHTAAVFAFGTLLGGSGQGSGGGGIATQQGVDLGGAAHPLGDALIREVEFPRRHGEVVAFVQGVDRQFGRQVAVTRRGRTFAP